MSVTISRGIQIVKWKNKDKQKVQLRYRVRIKRKGFTADRLFDHLKDAEQFLTLSKTQEGQAFIESQANAEEQPQTRKSSILQQFSIGLFLDNYVHSVLFVRIRSRPYRVDQQGIYLARSRQIKNTLVDDVLDPKYQSYPSNARRLGLVGPPPRVEFGKLPPQAVNGRVITSYIRSRLSSGKQPTTVKRELALLSAMFEWLKRNDAETWDLLGKTNPCASADRESLRTALEKKRAVDSSLPDKRVSAQQDQALLKALETYSNPEIRWIVLLCKLTGMRRSEVLLLEWHQIKSTYIQLQTTKSGQPRRVAITPEVANVLREIPRNSSLRVFRYTTSGFNAVWRRILSSTVVNPETSETLATTGFKLHHLRNEYISRLLEHQISHNLPSLVTQKLAGFSEPAYFQRNWVEPALENDRIQRQASTNLHMSDQDIQRSAGHQNLRMTSHYVTLTSAALSDATTLALSEGKASDGSTYPVLDLDL